MSVRTGSAIGLGKRGWHPAVGRPRRSGVLRAWANGPLPVVHNLPKKAKLGGETVGFLEETPLGGWRRTG